MKFNFIVLSFSLVVISALGCKKEHQKTDKASTNIEKVAQLPKTQEEFKLVDKLENISFSVLLFKRDLKYKIEFKNNTNKVINDSSFETTKSLTTIYACENEIDRNEYYIAIFDSNDEVYRTWILKNNLVEDTGNNFNCYDHESEEYD